MDRDPTTPGRRTQAQADRPLVERRYRWARAYRDGQLVCGRVDLTIRVDGRLGLARHACRCVGVRFVERLDPVLRIELAGLVRRHGAAVRRAADRMDPIELVYDDARSGRHRIIGWVEPPLLRYGDLADIEFRLREPAP